jgi:hypothetical protein
MVVSEDVLAQVVSEVSASNSNPRFVEETVGAFMRRQPIVGNYVASYHQELGVEGVVLVLLHAAIVARAVERAAGRRLQVIDPAMLDSVVKRAANDTEFAKDQPALRDYLGANVAEDAAFATPVKRDQALYLLRVVASALADVF